MEEFNSELNAMWQNYVLKRIYARQIYVVGVSSALSRAGDGKMTVPS